MIRQWKQPFKLIMVERRWVRLITNVLQSSWRSKLLSKSCKMRIGLLIIRLNNRRKQEIKLINQHTQWQQLLSRTRTYLSLKQFLNLKIPNSGATPLTISIKKAKLDKTIKTVKNHLHLYKDISNLFILSPKTILKISPTILNKEKSNQQSKLITKKPNSKPKNEATLIVVKLTITKTQMVIMTLVSWKTLNFLNTGQEIITTLKKLYLQRSSVKLISFLRKLNIEQLTMIKMRFSNQAWLISCKQMLLKLEIFARIKLKLC